MIKIFLEYAKKLLQMVKSPALGKIWQSMAGERKRIALLSVLQMLSALLGLGSPLVMRSLVDSAVAGDSQRVTGSVLALIGMIACQMLLAYIRRIAELKARTNLQKNMRAEAVHRLLHKQYGAMQSYHSGEVVNRIFSDVGAVASGVLNIVPPLLFLLIQLVGAAIILYRMNGRFMMILLIAGALGAAASFGFRHKMKEYYKTAQLAGDKFHARIQETLGNLRIIKASGIEERMESQAGETQQTLIAAQLRQGRFSALMGTGLGIIFRGSWLYALMWGCMGIYRGELTYGTLTAILQLVSQIQSPFEGLISTMTTAFGTVSSAERLMELYDLPDEIPQPVSDVPERFEAIRLHDVSFAYERGEDVLRGVNLTIREGDVTAIMGQSGIGKSTLFLLLLGIYAPKEGRISVDFGEKEVEGSVRSLFAYVPQGNALFSGTLRDNIAMFCRTKPSDEAIWKAAELACIDDFIREQAQGMDTVLGEHGIGLSEGQAQRIAIARALLTDCPVLLLDEATSALDESTEARLLENIAGLKNRTCLIVTHRRAALAICSRRIEVKEGQVEEAGVQE